MENNIEKLLSVGMSEAKIRPIFSNISKEKGFRQIFDQNCSKFEAKVKNFKTLSVNFVFSKPLL